MKFTDAVTIAGTRRRDDGYLVADARVARVGIQTYAGWEVGQPAKETVSVYRAPDVVFARDAMTSFAHRPVTNDHPDENVTADTWKDYAVGNTSDEVARDGDFLRVPLMVSDAAAIKQIEDGKRELSAGYSCDLVMTDGVTPEGEAYDAIQKNIKANHIAIVSRGRAGPQVRIGDGAGNGGGNRTQWGAAPLIDHADTKGTRHMTDTLRTVMVDGLQVKTTDEGAAAIEKLNAKIADGEKALNDARAEHATALADKDKEIATKDAEIDGLKGKLLSDADLDKRVQARAALVDSARKVVADVKIEGLSDAEIRKAVVKAKLGDEKIADKSDAYVEARFDGLVEAAESGQKTEDKLAQTRMTSTSVSDANEKARVEAEEAERNAWKRKAAA